MSDLIFGYTWDEIKKAQQGGTLQKLTPLAAKMAEGDICTRNDLALFEKFGINGLIERKFYGTLDRLQQAGIYNPHEDKECLGPGCLYCDEQEAI
jgi:hypothetical protein